MVPPGYLNDAGTTVTIAEPAIEFGAQTSTNLFTANFTDTQLIVTDMSSAPFGGTSFLMSFTDSAFTGLSATTVSDDYANRCEEAPVVDINSLPTSTVASSSSRPQSRMTGSASTQPY
jgi:hypothetical protein